MDRKIRNVNCVNFTSQCKLLEGRWEKRRGLVVSLLSEVSQLLETSKFFLFFFLLLSLYDFQFWVWHPPPSHRSPPWRHHVVPADIWPVTTIFENVWWIGGKYSCFLLLNFTVYLLFTLPYFSSSIVNQRSSFLWLWERGLGRGILVSIYGLLLSCFALLFFISYYMDCFSFD